MAHAFQAFLRRELDSRGWKQADLVRESGLSRALVSKYVADARETLSRPPEEATVAGLARGLRIEPRVIWTAVAEAMGLPAAAMPTIVHELKDSTDSELLTELQRRLAMRLVTDEEWAVQAEREKEREIIGEIEHDMAPVYTTRSENPHPRRTIEHRRFEAERADGIAMLEDLIQFFKDYPKHADSRGEPVDIVIGGGARTILYAGDQVPQFEGERAARLGRGDLYDDSTPPPDDPPGDDS